MSDEMAPQQGAAPVQQRGAGGDAKAMMMFEANKKSVLVSYLLWFFLGMFGGHRFYNGKIGTAVTQLVFTIFGILFLFAFYFGLFLLTPIWIWTVVDAFLIPGWVRSHNSLLAMQLGAQ